VEGANKVIDHLRKLASQLKKGDKIANFSIDYADEFQYKDPVDSSVSSNQDALRDLIAVVLQTMKLKEFIGTEEPTVIT